MPWYEFTPTLSPSQPANPNEYTLIPNPLPCPGSNEVLCVIQANDNMGKPILNLALVSEIALALQNRIDTTNVKLKP